MLHTKFGIGLVVLEKKMLTDDGRQPIAIGHLMLQDEIGGMLKKCLRGEKMPQWFNKCRNM